MSGTGIEPDTVTHLSTNRVRRRLTSLIKANVLTTTPDHQTVSNQQCQCTEGNQLVLQIRLESHQDHSTMLQ